MTWWMVPSTWAGHQLHGAFRYCRRTGQCGGFPEPGRAKAGTEQLYCLPRKLDNSLAGHYGGWMTMGVLGWVFGGCFAIAALVMAVLAGVAPNDASLWSAMPVFNILAPMFTACTLGFFVMGYAGCHAANYFGRLAALPARHARLYGGLPS